MGKRALNTYLEPRQKVRLERLARRRKTSQATVVREAIEEYLGRHAPEQKTRSVDAAWECLLGGYYSGDGNANDHDDIYK
ncbi:MAG TPA: CopG family transcriptional regulator [Polyangiaceae bacterium]|jgi:hypothetical protein